jgi:hypothetical protein
MKLPIWIRLPEQSSHCPYTCLKKGQLDKLVKNSSNEIKICHLKGDGAKRGTVLIHLQSLLDFLDRKAS